MGELYPITRAWIQQHRTRNGGWTRRQIEALGESWPPVKGWMKRANGRLISPQRREDFERDAAPRRNILDDFWAAVERGENRIELLRHYVTRSMKNDKTPEQTRQAFQRPKYRKYFEVECWVCRGEAKHRHHVIPIVSGGTNDRLNIVSLCEPCHERVHPWMKTPAVPLPREVYRSLWD